MINLAEETLDYIASCGYGIENVKGVRAMGVNDGVMYGVDFEKFIEAAKEIEYDENDASKVHISLDLAVLMDDGSAFCRDVDAVSKFEWYRWHPNAGQNWNDKSDLVMAEPDEVKILMD